MSWRELAHPNAGGSEVLVHGLIERLVARGHTATLVCGGPVGRARGYEVVRAGGTYDQYLRAPLIARRRDADLLVDVANGVPYFSPLWWRGPRLCLFTHLHADQWHAHFPPLVATIGAFTERRVMPRLYRTTRFVAISPSTSAALQRLGVAASRIHVCYPGIDAAMMQPAVPKAEEPLFVVLGRIAANKRVDRILDAWERVGPVLGGRLVVIGDGPVRGQLEARRVPAVEFPGRVSEADKRDLLGSAWLLLHAAQHEGWGIGIMEAAAQGTPTLAFDVDGVRDSVVAGETGRLVASQRAFEAEWLALARDRPLLTGMGTAARQRAMAFTWDRSADEFLDAAVATVGRR